MASLDPTFARGFQLMFSDEPDSTAELRAMLDEAIMNKYGVNLKIPPELDTEEPRPSDEVRNTLCKDESTSSSDDSNEAPAAVNFEDSFSMHLTDLSCVICGQLNVGVRNQLIECNTCQKLYHQDCHIPPITAVVDGINVWNCASCEENNPVFIDLVEEEITSTGFEGEGSSSSTTPCSNLDANCYQYPSTSDSNSAKASSSKMDSNLKLKRHSSSHASMPYHISSGSRHST